MPLANTSPVAMTSPGAGLKAVAGLGEIDASIRRHGHGIGKDDGIGVRHPISDQADLALGRHAKQAFVGIGGNQVTVAVEVETQHPTASVRHLLQVAAITLQAHDVAVVQRGVQPTIGAQGHMFGAGP